MINTPRLAGCVEKSILLLIKSLYLSINYFNGPAFYRLWQRGFHIGLYAFISLIINT